MNNPSPEQVQEFFARARLSMARTLLPTVKTEDDEAVAHAFMTTLDEEVESPTTRSELSILASCPAETIDLFLETYPRAIIAYTREAVVAQLSEGLDLETQESLKRLLTFLKKVSHTLTHTVH